MASALYPSGPEPATLSLEALLREEIVSRGPLPFRRFLELALYHPALGYYARRADQVGRGGDFFTSVSTGPLFGRLLATRFLRWWRETGRPSRWRLIEAGAHDGRLAADLLTEISSAEPAALEGLEYVAVEPLPALREAQRARLAEWGARFRQVACASELHPALPGVAFGNEVIDALPFDRVEWRDGVWRELRVALDPETRGFVWQRQESAPPPDLAARLARLDGPFPDGWRGEIRRAEADFLAPFLGALSRGLLLWPDYGFARPECHHPDRREGTLRTYSRHRAGADPFVRPGELDITAHVDFTSLAEEAIGLGCRVSRFASQGSWLTREARPSLLALEGRPSAESAAALRQFQTLTHPAQLGAAFHMLELAWNDPSLPDLPPEERHRLALASDHG